MTTNLVHFPVQSRTAQARGNVTPGEDYIYSRVSGDALSSDGILEGDFILCRPLIKGENIEGRLVSAKTPNGYIIRRCYPTLDGRICFRAANPKHADLMFMPDEIELTGVAVRWERDL